MREILNNMIEKLKNISSEKSFRHALTREDVEMAVIDVLSVGFVKGRLGRWRVRWQNGKPVVSKKADVYNASQSLASVKNRNQMGAAFRFAAALNKGILKEIWTNAEAEGYNSYTRLIKHFRKNLKSNFPSTGISITPPEFHFLNENPVNLNSNQTIKICNKIYSDSSLIVVLVPFDPVKTGLKDFEVFSFCVTDVSEIHLSSEQYRICGNYSKYMLYSVVIQHNEHGLLWSDTLSTEGKFAVQHPSSNIINYHTFSPFSLFEMKSPEIEIKTKRKKAHPPPGRTAA